MLVNKKKIKEIKNNLRLSNFQPSWSDVFFENFYNNWKKILEKNENILIVAPHPDDELVGASLIISRLIDKKKIIIFFPTNGVISKGSMWFWSKIKLSINSKY